MSGDLTWRPLPLATSPGLPVLLVSVDIGTAVYTVRVTDMANIWVESLDRKAICMRGWAEDTSIDPSDTPENMAKFLSSLRSALDPSQPGHDQTSLTLSPGSKTEAGDDGLILNVTCPLPGFQPLKWPIHLKRSPPSAVATDLVLPLIEAHFARKLEVESLVQALSHKDAVITKLADKLEATGTGLENVFTSLAGRKKVTRTLAEEKIKGLAAFNQRKWRAGLGGNEGWPANTSDLVQDVFSGDGLQSRSMLQVESSPDWWQNFEGTSQLAHRSQQQTGPQAQQTPSPPTSCTNADDDDDDFQAQPTPPHLRPAGKDAAANVPAADDASTADEDEPAIPARAPPATSSEGSDIKKPASKMGSIGGKKQAAASPPKTPSSHKEKALPSADDSETASEAGDDDETASIPESAPLPPQPSPPKAPPKQGGLGRIGGPAAKTHVAEKAKSPEAEASEANEMAANPPARKKLGVIGKKIGNATTKPSAGEDVAGRGRGAVREEEAQVEEQPRETSQERADRRREELKRELERKAAGPVKKKRRF